MLVLDKKKKQKTGNHTPRNRLKQIIVISVLSISIITSVAIKMQPTQYGWELFGYDPFFNYRATEYLITNGLESYFNWHDNMSWYPDGRDISQTSQVVLHLTAAGLYTIFGNGQSLYNFLIILPVIFSSATILIVFGLIRKIAGTYPALIASFLFAVSAPIAFRGLAGWFRSEPLGLLLGLSAIYLFLCGIQSHNYKNSAMSLVGAGVLMAFGLSAWGGVHFFVLSVSAFFIILPFLRNDYKFTLFSATLFIGTVLLTSLIFERPGLGFVLGLGGLSLGGSLLIMGTIYSIRKVRRKPITIMSIAMVLTLAVLVGLYMIEKVEQNPNERYLAAILPFTETQNPLVESVDEHQPLTGTILLNHSSLLLLFGGIGALYILVKYQKRDSYIFCLILSVFGIYLGLGFVRLELLLNLSLIMLSSIAFYEILSKLWNKVKHGSNLSTIVFSLLVATLILMPIIPFSGPSWIDSINQKPLILSQEDWIESLNWIKQNTPNDAVILSWWDYGYWITAKGERTTIVDNGSINPERISQVAKILTDPEHDAWKWLVESDVDYVLLYVESHRMDKEKNSYEFGHGDETKSHWMLKIAGKDPHEYYTDDSYRTFNRNFWDNTLLGKMIPFQYVGFSFETNNSIQNFKAKDTNNVYEPKIKYSYEGNAPLKLAYLSPSLKEMDDEVHGIIIYEVNKRYLHQE